MVVLFEPYLPDVVTLLNALRDQCRKTILIDNSQSDAAGQTLLSHFGDFLAYESFRQNKGIAAAQNEGIRVALTLGAEALLFLDQDSQVPPNFIYELSREFEDSSVLVTAPGHDDLRSGFSYPAVNVDRKGRRTKHNLAESDAPIDISVAISSGMLVRAKVFELVGMMDEDLFIDYVDTEWCLRCANVGIPVRFNPGVRLKHAIGNGFVQMGRFRMPVHGPLRRYYRLRNPFLLWRYPHIPIRLCVQEILFGLVHQVALVMTQPRKWDYCRIYVQALTDGLKGKRGSSGKLADAGSHNE